MQEKLFYEYAVLRIVPRPERQEFVNIGVILYCKQKKLVLFQYAVSAEKLKALHTEADVEMLKKNVEGFSAICAGSTGSGSPISLLDAASRFRWLTAKRSTMLQCSAVHIGWCYNIDAQLAKIFSEQIS